MRIAESGLRIGLNDTSNSIFDLSAALLKAARPLVKRSAPQACPEKCEMILIAINGALNEMTTMKDFRHANR